MKIPVAPDSFKESIDAANAAKAIARGIRDVLPAAEIVLLPIADGGEGTVDALITSGNGRFIETWVSGPLGEPVLPAGESLPIIQPSSRWRPPGPPLVPTPAATRC